MSFVVHLYDFSLIFVDCIFGKDKLVIVATDSSFYCRNSIFYLANATVSLMKTFFHLSDVSLTILVTFECRHRMIDSSNLALDCLLHIVDLLTLFG